MQHPAFAKLGEVSFRPAESDATPVLILPLGPTFGAVPLRSIQAEFGIANESADGEMLTLIARALQFVGELRLGDPLPLEILGGGASWEPDPAYLEIARDRVRLQIVALFDEEGGDAAEWVRADPSALRHAMAGPGMQYQLQAAMIELAATLGLRDAAAATATLDGVAQELSFLEALRDRLLGRVQSLLMTVEALTMTMSSHPAGTELIGRVRRLASIAATRMQARFSTIEAITAAILPLCRDLDAQRTALREHRDWLHCCLRAWDGVLEAWARAGDAWTEETWPLLARTYKFLAPRYMPVQEWALSHRGAQEGARTQMVW